MQGLVGISAWIGTRGRGFVWVLGSGSRVGV